MKPGRSSPTANRRQDVANDHQLNDENLGFSSFSPRKGRQDVGTFREASRSWLPLPSRWTFTSAIQAAVHCTSAALRHPGFACFRSSLEDTGSPSLACGVTAFDAASSAVNEPANRRQDVANDHQLNDENLGFSSFSPRKGRQDVGAVRKIKPGPDAARYCVCCGSRSRCPR